MSESVKRFKANRVIDGRECTWCSQSIPFGADAAVCAQCDAPHHAPCWDDKGGCSTHGCVAAPLQQLAPVVDKVAPAGMVYCPHCGEIYPKTDANCVHCRRFPTPDGQYHGPRQNAPGAVASVVWGILGFFLCGLIFGFIAISNANSAQKAIAADPRFGGSGLATAGKVLGIISIVASAVMIVFQLAMMYS